MSPVHVADCDQNDYKEIDPTADAFKSRLTMVTDAQVDNLPVEDKATIFFVAGYAGKQRWDYFIQNHDDTSVLFM